MPRTHDPTLAARRRAQILEAAMVCFRRRGFHQATMQEICAEARVSPGALYRYFDSKAAIIIAIAQDEHVQLEPLFAALEDGGDVRAGLVELAKQVWAKFHAAGDASLIGDVMAEAGRDPALAGLIHEADGKLRARLAAVLAAAQKRGEVDRALKPDNAARLVLAVIDGIGVRLSLFRQSDLAQPAADFASLIGRYLAPAAPVVAKSPAAKTPVAKTPAVKTSAVKTPAAKPQAVKSQKSKPPVAAPRRAAPRVKEKA
jgi:TetR/AcrR family transcriptional regulator, repressor for uid operon